MVRAARAQIGKKGMTASPYGDGEARKKIVDVLVNLTS
jgi:hypothetical protein